MVDFLHPHNCDVRRSFLEVATFPIAGWGGGGGNVLDPSSSALLQGRRHPPDMQ